MSIIPEYKAKELDAQFSALDKNKLSIAIYICEQMAELKYGQHEQFWKEMSERSRGCAPETLRQWGRIVEGYDEKKLLFWHENGLSFDHFETAKFLVNHYRKETKGKTAENLLDDCLAYGSKTGGGNMTVQDMRDLYMRDGSPIAPRLLFDRMMNSILKFRIFEPQKQARFAELARKFREDVERECL